ncbi:hypothetical protein SNE40_021766 [Patella caerulea]|uniref:Uncharacterized protein n=1 Tax=Patella caerulea TaxID=87958 RepID=A0AAN8G4U4_PATCE
MKHLKNKNEELRRKLRTLQRRNQRSVTKNTNSHSSPHTPRSQAKNDMRNAGLSQRQGDKIRQQLIFGNALISEISSARKEIGNKKEQVKTLKSIASGKIIKKYRGLNWLSKQTGISRNKLGSGGKSIQLHSKVKRCSVQKRFLSDATSFLERDDNSRCQPGKADSKKDETGARQQTRVLTDYLDNLHKKFLSENPNIVLSLATFCRMRPKYILLTSFISRSCCLCTKHQNMALILKLVRREGVMVSSNPETYLKECVSNPVNFDMLPEKIKLGQWKRITVTEKGKEKSVMRIVESEIEKSTFIDLVIAQTTDFKDQSFRVGKQYNEIKKLKENLPQHQFIIKMDFAENYNCKSVEEIQSAYWNQTSVTLHPVVAYYRNTIGEMCHTSYVVVSDELGHSSTTVHAFLDILIPEIKLIDPDVDIIHYWTDSPTSQYRNKQIF